VSVHGAGVLALPLVAALASCGPRRTNDPLSVLPPLCNPLSSVGPDGCLAIVQTAEKDEFRFAQQGGVVVAVTDRRSTGLLQTEVSLNGTTTWTRTTRRTAEGQWLGSVVAEFQPSTGKLLREETYRRGAVGNMVQAKARSFEAAGRTAEFVWEFRFSQTAWASGESGPTPMLQNLGCTPEEFRVLQTDLRGALLDGLACMRRDGRSDIAALILSRYHRGPVQLACVRSLEVSATGFLAGSDATSYMGVTGATRLSFDRPSYFRHRDGGRTRTIWHELLHLWAGPHTKLDAGSADRDRTNACVSLCFNTPSKCACELCLGLPRGDAHCSGFADCPAQAP
jgi:hypothetical protein